MQEEPIYRKYLQQIFGITKIIPIASIQDKKSCEKDKKDKSSKTLSGEK